MVKNHATEAVQITMGIKEGTGLATKVHDAEYSDAEYSVGELCTVRHEKTRNSLFPNNKDFFVYYSGLPLCPLCLNSCPGVLI